jgi:flagellar motor switch/type III secretory pathway protein FliN
MAAALAVPQPPAELLSAAARQVGWLPCRLQAEISLRGFTVGDLLRLEVGAIVDSGVAVESDIAVRVNGASVGSAKLELAGSHLAVRLTELI